MSEPSHTVAALRKRGVIGLEISACSRCGATTKATWEEMGAREDEDVADVADRALACDLCGLSSRESDVTRLHEGSA